MEGSIRNVQFYCIKINSFSNCVRIDCKFKNGWFQKGFCEDELQKYEDAGKRLILIFFLFSLNCILKLQ